VLIKYSFLVLVKHTKEQYCVKSMSEQQSTETDLESTTESAQYLTDHHSAQPDIHEPTETPFEEPSESTPPLQSDNVPVDGSNSSRSVDASSEADFTDQPFETTSPDVNSCQVVEQSIEDTSKGQPASSKVNPIQSADVVPPSETNEEPAPPDHQSSLDDEIANESYSEDDESDEDYDPETIIPYNESSEKLPAPAEPVVDKNLQSVLAMYAKPSSESSSTPSSGSSKPVSESIPEVPLHKLLSNITSSDQTTPDQQVLDKSMTAEEAKAYEDFLRVEAEFVASGRWDRFIYGSRMFIGNLPKDKVTKSQLFRIFHRYGRMAQIAMKQAYGFIQFFDAESCAAAIKGAQGFPLRGNFLRKLLGHL
jgi:hypothetical protein